MAQECIISTLQIPPSALTHYIPFDITASECTLQTVVTYCYDRTHKHREKEKSDARQKKIILWPVFNHI